MVRKLILAVAAAAVLPLLGLGAATAAPAIPAAHSTNCDVNSTFCNFLANYTADWWAEGTVANEGIISSNGLSNQWWYRPKETGWGILENKDGNCLNYAANLGGEIVTSSCSSGINANELFHFSAGPSGSDLVANYTVGTGNYFWIDNASGVFIEIVSGTFAGDELHMRA